MIDMRGMRGYNIECVLLSCNFDFLLVTAFFYWLLVFFGYLVVTACYLVVTGRSQL